MIGTILRLMNGVFGVSALGCFLVVLGIEFLAVEVVSFLGLDCVFAVVDFLTDSLFATIFDILQLL
jgi:hypothetical protein